MSDGVGVVNCERGLITPKLFGAGDFVYISDCHPFIDGNYVVNRVKDKIVEIKIPFHKGLSREYHGSKFKHKYHGGILSSQVVSRKNVFPVIILGLNDGTLSNVRQTCKHVMNYLAGILNDAIQVMWAASFAKEKPDCEFRKRSEYHQRKRKLG